MIRLLFFLAAVTTLLGGCAQAPAVVTANNPAPKFPAYFAQHSSGILVRPSDADVAEAIKFGRSFKDTPDLMKDAYLSRPKQTTVSLEKFYILVRTPLYLVVREAMERAIAGQAPDPQFIAFARGLGFVRIAVSQRYTSFETWTAYAIDRKMTLLRDGQPVAPATKVPAWKGGDPFVDPADPLASWQADSWLKHGVEDMEMGELRQREEHLEKRSRLTGTSGGQSPSALIDLEPDAAVFPIGELRKPGRYEILFHRPRPAGSDEPVSPDVRIPISFAPFP